MPKGKKEKEKKTKKAKKEPQVSYYQAITSYKITMKEKEIDDYNEELKQLLEINSNLRQRNRRLLETRSYNMERASEEFKNFSKAFNAREKCSREEVLNELKDLWRFKLNEEKNIISQKRELKRLEREINDNKRELQLWVDFRDYGQHQLSTQIRLLKKELEDMNENYKIMSSSITTNLTTTIEQIKTSTEEAIQKKNKSVALRAFNHLDKSFIDKSHENKWMDKQVDILKQEIAELEEKTSNMEKENINLMGHLFDCNNEEFHIIKSLFEIQFLDNENLEENPIMNVDLDELTSIRPKSALGLVMRKLKAIEFKATQPNQVADNLQIQTTESQLEIHHLPELSPRFLCLYGTKKLIASETDEATAGQKNQKNEESAFKLDASYSTTHFWPITQPMLKDVLDS